MTTTVIKTNLSRGQLLERLQTVYPNCVIDFETGHVATPGRWPWWGAGIIFGTLGALGAGLTYWSLTLWNPADRHLPQWVTWALLSAFGVITAAAWLRGALHRDWLTSDVRVHQEGRQYWVLHEGHPEGLSTKQALELEHLKAALAPRRSG